MHIQPYLFFVINTRVPISLHTIRDVLSTVFIVGGQNSQNRPHGQREFYLSRMFTTTWAIGGASTYAHPRGRGPPVDRSRLAGTSAPAACSWAKESRWKKYIMEAVSTAANASHRPPMEATSLKIYIRPAIRPPHHPGRARLSRDDENGCLGL